MTRAFGESEQYAYYVFLHGLFASIVISVGVTFFFLEVTFPVVCCFVMLSYYFDAVIVIL